MNPRPVTPEGAVATAAPGLAANLATELRERIVHWRYPPGHRFTEDELCREFGISRSPVREALKVLTASGFVEQLPRRGYVVRQLEVREIEELYEVRLALEHLVVSSLATRETPASGLDDARREWTSLLEQPPDESSTVLARLDEGFHEGLAQLHGNRTLVTHLRAINERLLIFRTMDFESPARIEQTCHQHLAVLERIAAGDPDGARIAIARNITDGHSIVETAIGNALARAYVARSKELTGDA